MTLLPFHDPVVVKRSARWPACQGGTLFRLFGVVATLAVATTVAVRAQDLLLAQNQNATGASITLVPSAAFYIANDSIGPPFGNGHGSTYSLNGVAHKFLQRHGVPCLFVLKVGSPHDLGEIATCQDGREWALFWLEDEIAFVHPQTGESYKWDHQIYMSLPETYAGPNPSNEHQVLLGTGP